MTRNDVLNDERIKRYSEGKATPEDTYQLQGLAHIEPLYAEALTLFAPLTEGEQSRILEHARLQVQLTELKDAVRAVGHAMFKCARCDGWVTHWTEGAEVCDKHAAERSRAGYETREISFPEPVRRLQALLEADEHKGPADKP